MIQEYYEQLYAHKFDNLDNKIGQFLERHNLPKLTRERDHLRSQQPAATVVGDHSHNCVTLYGKGEGNLQM